MNSQVLWVLLLLGLAPVQPAASDGLGDAARAQAAFHQADADGNGKVDRREARRAGIGSKAMAAANGDDDRSLDRNEFAAAMREQAQRSDRNDDRDDRDSRTLDRKEARKAGIGKQAFDAADADEDGRLDRDERAEALARQARRDARRERDK